VFIWGQSRRSGPLAHPARPGSRTATDRRTGVGRCRSSPDRRRPERSVRIGARGKERRSGEPAALDRRRGKSRIQGRPRPVGSPPSVGPRCLPRVADPLTSASWLAPPGRTARRGLNRVRFRSAPCRGRESRARSRRGAAPSSWARRSKRPRPAQESATRSVNRVRRDRAVATLALARGAAEIMTDLRGPDRRAAAGSLPVTPPCPSSLARRPLAGGPRCRFPPRLPVRAPIPCPAHAFPPPAPSP
jgi:hypothetical protein